MRGKHVLVYTDDVSQLISPNTGLAAYNVAGINYNISNEIH